MQADEMIDALESTGDYRVISRLKKIEEYAQPPEGALHLGIGLDTETTGLDADNDQLIELGMVPFTYDDEGRIYQVFEAFDQLIDPGQPISDEITKITGITDEMVKGQHLNRQAIIDFVGDTNPLIIAHNAGFDRPFVERLDPIFESCPWGCSVNDIDWRESGFESAKQEYLAYRHGFFYEGHRAETDVRAMIHLLTQAMPDGRPALRHVLDKVQKPAYQLYATGAPFEAKDTLKARGYSWSPGDGVEPKAWYINVSRDDLPSESEWLKTSVFNGQNRMISLFEINADRRYSRRFPTRDRRILLGNMIHGGGQSDQAPLDSTLPAESTGSVLEPIDIHPGLLNPQSKMNF